MNKAAIILMVVCLGLPFVNSFKKSTSRTYRRYAILFGFLIMIVASAFLPKMENYKPITQEQEEAEEEVVEEEEEIIGGIVNWMYASDVDTEVHEVIAWESVEADNYLQSSKDSFPVEKMFDGKEKTCWQDGVDGFGEETEIRVHFAEAEEIPYFLILNGRSVTDEKKFKDNGRVKQLCIEANGYSTPIVLPDEMKPIWVSLENWGEISDLTLRIDSVYEGEKYQDTCITEVTFFR